MISLSHWGMFNPQIKPVVPVSLSQWCGVFEEIWGEVARYSQGCS